MYDFNGPTLGRVSQQLLDISHWRWSAALVVVFSVHHFKFYSILHLIHHSSSLLHGCAGTQQSYPHIHILTRYTSVVYIVVASEFLHHTEVANVLQTTYAVPVFFWLVALNYPHTLKQSSTTLFENVLLQDRVQYRLIAFLGDVKPGFFLLGLESFPGLTILGTQVLKIQSYFGITRPRGCHQVVRDWYFCYVNLCSGTGLLSELTLTRIIFIISCHSVAFLSEFRTEVEESSLNYLAVLWI